MPEDENKRSENRSSESNSSAEIKLELRDYLDEKIDRMRSGIDAMYHRDKDSFEKDVESHKKDITKQNKKYFSIALVILALFGLTSVSGYYALFKWVASRTEEVLESEIETAREKATQALDDEVDKIKQQVSSRLDEEFQTERIQSLIANTAEEYTEGRVDEYIFQRVDDAIAPVSEAMELSLASSNEDLQSLKNDMEESIKKVEESLGIADAQLEIINSQVTVFELYFSANFGSRKAYRMLLVMASPDTLEGTMARSRIVVLERNLSLYRFPPRIIIGGLTYEKDGKKVELDDVSANVFFRDLENPSLHEGIRHKLMHYILQKDEKEILPEALRLLKESDSLPACAATCGILRKKLGDKAEFLDFEGWIKVCEEELAAISEKETDPEKPDSP